LAVIDEVAFVAAWIDVKAGDRTWLPVLRDVLRMRENLDLRWIPPSKYSSLEGNYVEIAVDGETREATDIRPT
jgi:hypothetical protein